MIESSKQEEKIKTLLVDDEEPFLEQEKIFIQRINKKLDPETTTSPKKALKLLKNNEYDCIVSDYQMPDIDGLEFLKKIREGLGIDIPFIMFTGKGKEEVAMEALNLGANRYLRKGGDPKSQYGVLADAIIQEVNHYNSEKQMEKARKEWRRTFDALPDIAALISPNHEILRVNKKGAESLGMEREEIIGKKCYEIVHDQDSPINQCPCEKVLETGKPDVGEIFKENGRYYIASASPLLDDNGEVEAFAHTVKDVTERMKAVNELRKTNEKLQTIFESTEDGVIMTDFKGNIIEANKAAARIAGFEDKEEYMKYNIFEFVHPEDRETLEEAVEKTLKEGEVQDRTEYRIRTKNGKTIHTRTSTSLIRDDSGEPFATVNIVRDITDQKEAEEKLKESRKRFMNIFNELGDPIFIVSPGPENPSNILEVNPAATDLTGYTKEELIGMNMVEDLAYEGPFELSDEDVKKKLRKGETVKFTGKLKDKEGNKHFINITNTPIKYRGESAVLSINHDITDQKKKEEELKKAREEYRELINGMNDTGWVIDFDGNILEVNESAVEKLGYSRDELLSMRAHDIDASLDPGDITGLIKDMIKDEIQVFETVHETKDGEKIPVEISSSLITYHGEQAILSIARDISKRKEAESRFKKLFEGGPEPMVLLDKDNKIVDINSRFEEVFGYDLEEVRGEGIDDVVTPDRLREEGEKLNKEGKDGYVNYKTVREGKNREFPVSISSTPVTIKDETYVIAVYRDITEREEAIERRDFLHSLLRHDVRNKIQLVLGYKELLEDLDLPEKAEEYVSKEKKGVESAHEIIEKVNVLRRAEEELIKELDICSLVHDHVEEWRSQASDKGVEIDLKCPEENCEVKGGPLLKEIFSNIIENSLQHSDGNKIRINEKRNKDEIICIIEDDGKGLSDEEKDKIFNKGFTTDRERGTGLGMYLAKELIETYNGKIEVKDSDLGGARFDLHLQKA